MIAAPGLGKNKRKRDDAAGDGGPAAAKAAKVVTFASRMRTAVLAALVDSRDFTSDLADLVVGYTVTYQTLALFGRAGNQSKMGCVDLDDPDCDAALDTDGPGSLIPTAAAPTTDIPFHCVSVDKGMMSAWSRDRPLLHAAIPLARISPGHQVLIRDAEWIKVLSNGHVLVVDANVAAVFDVRANPTPSLTVVAAISMTHVAVVGISVRPPLAADAAQPQDLARIWTTDGSLQYTYRHGAFTAQSLRLTHMPNERIRHVRESPAGHLAMLTDARRTFMDKDGNLMAMPDASMSLFGTTAWLDDDRLASSNWSCVTVTDRATGRPVWRNPVYFQRANNITATADGFVVGDSQSLHHFVRAGENHYEEIRRIPLAAGVDRLTVQIVQGKPPARS